MVTDGTIDLRSVCRRSVVPDYSLSNGEDEENGVASVAIIVEGIVAVQLIEDILAGIGQGADPCGKGGVRHG